PPSDMVQMEIQVADVTREKLAELELSIAARPEQGLVVDDLYMRRWDVAPMGGHLRMLTAPTVICLDNQPCVVSLIQDAPVPDRRGVVSTNVELAITPKLLRNGRLQLVIGPTILTSDARQTESGEEPVAPTKTKQHFEFTTEIADGQTVGLA